jgi:SpoVK/Ycf46/Vps4 family AAA+-type ATPase
MGGAPVRRYGHRVAGDPSVIDAIAKAVDADPGNPALRIHLAGLLQGVGRSTEALTHAAAALAVVPDDLDALRVAVAAADAVGESALADGYRRLLVALGGAEPAPPVAGRSEVPDTADGLLERWAESDALTEVEIGELTAPGIRLADVGGMVAVKQRLDLSFLSPMRNPEMRLQFGASLRGGLLLWGPPGCGKTFIARATAGELGASFYEVGLSDVLDMWIGSSERNLSSIFDVARRNRPCVLFFDEMDALGLKRTQLRAGGAAMRGVVNQLLAELDGATSDNDGVFVLAATNHPWDVDPALLRPGRLDRMLLVLPPDLEARVAILDLHLRGKPTARLDLAKVAKLTDGWSGADLALLCDHATERAMSDSITSGVVRPIAQSDLAQAAKEIRPSIGAWMETARNFALFNNDGGAYDELLAYFKPHR